MGLENTVSEPKSAEPLLHMFEKVEKVESNAELKGWGVIEHTKVKKEPKIH